MSGYIGSSLVGQNTQIRTTVSATSGQTVLISNGYQPGYLDIFRIQANGTTSKLINGIGFIANNSPIITLTTPAVLGDTYEVISYLPSDNGNPRGIINRQSYIATQNQTVFNVKYTVGDLDVFLNGIKLYNTDFVATNGSSITLLNPANAGDKIDLLAYTSYSVDDILQKSLNGSDIPSKDIFLTNLGIINTGLSLVKAVNTSTAQTILGITPAAATLLDDPDIATIRNSLSLDHATQSAAELGAATTGSMPPLRTAQHVAARHVNSAVVITNGAASYDVTGIPSWARKVTVMLNGVSGNGTAFKMLQLGDSGDIETAGYEAGAFNGTDSGKYVTSGSAFPFSVAANSSNGYSYYGAVSFTLLDPATNLWVAGGTVHEKTYGVGVSIAGTKALSQPLGRIRLLTTNIGGETFIGGSMAVRWEV